MHIKQNLVECVVGPIQNVGHQNSLKCNRVAVQDASTDKLSRHHFLIENASKEMSIEQMFEQMYYSDMTEKGAQIGKIDGNPEQLSKNGKRFPGNFGCRHREEWEPLCSTTDIQTERYQNPE